MAFRTISGLKWAAKCERPSCIPLTRPGRGAKGQGVRYERALAWAVPVAVHGQWFEFEDSNGLGYCQTDLLMLRGSKAVCLEAKYTWTPVGHWQLERLYRPVVEEALGRDFVGIQVCKTLLPETARHATICSSLEEALCAEGRLVWHWLGGVRGPRPRVSRHPGVVELLQGL